jgi:single-strand DNA-binding protein
MTDIANAFVIGRLTRDGERKSDKGPIRFSLAVNRSVKQGDGYKDEASFLDVEYWHRSLDSYLTKGKQIAIAGEIKQDRWTATDGSVRSRVVIEARTIQLLGGGQGQGQEQASAHPAAQGTVRGEDDFPDDIPF